MLSAPTAVLYTPVDVPVAMLFWPTDKPMKVLVVLELAVTCRVLVPEAFLTVSTGAVGELTSCTETAEIVPVNVELGAKLKPVALVAVIILE
jgi:hypothetical protein